VIHGLEPMGFSLNDNMITQPLGYVMYILCITKITLRPGQGKIMKTWGEPC
jgi:hypothetical protein